MGMEPLVSQAFGAGEHARARDWLSQGIYVGLVAAVPLSVGMMLATLVLEPLGVPAPIARTATAYLWSRLPGMLFNTLYAAHRAYLASIGNARPIVVAVVAANVANAILDAVLVFAFGLGAVGVGAATSICWVLMLGIVVVTVRAGDPRPMAAPDRSEMRKIFGLGWPIGLQLSAEVGVFAFVSLLIARFGEAALSGHQIAISLAAATFMCAVGVGVSATARVGHHIGAERSGLARRTGLLAMAIGTAVMAAGGVVFFVFSRPLAALFAPTDPEAQRIGAALLEIAAVFSISDGIQVVAAGALRGAGDTRWPFVGNVIAHWIIGLPLGIVLGHVYGLGAVGYWWGLTAGLTGTAIILAVRFLSLSSRPIARV
jgi:MATE family multidrug resistance protein